MTATVRQKAMTNKGNKEGRKEGRKEAKRTVRTRNEEKRGIRRYVEIHSAGKHMPGTSPQS